MISCCSNDSEVGFIRFLTRGLTLGTCWDLWHNLTRMLSLITVGPRCLPILTRSSNFRSVTTNIKQCTEVLSNGHCLVTIISEDNPVVKSQSIKEWPWNALFQKILLILLFSVLCCPSISIPTFLRTPGIVKGNKTFHVGHLGRHLATTSREESHKQVRLDRQTIKLDFPGHLWRAAFAIFAMFSWWWWWALI